MNKKILDINLIENLKKKKKTKGTTIEELNMLKEILINTIDDLIMIKTNNNCKYIDSEKFIKKNLIKFIELYININRNLRNINEKSIIIRDIINMLIDDIVIKSNNSKNTDLIKIIDLTKEKIKIEKFKNIKMQLNS
jgi:hypothetical protein